MMSHKTTELSVYAKKDKKITTSVTVMSCEGRRLGWYCDFEERMSRTGFRKNTRTTVWGWNRFPSWRIVTRDLSNNASENVFWFRSKYPHLGFIFIINNIIKIWKPSLPTWSSWSRMLMSIAGEHGSGTSFRGTPFDRTDPPNSDSSRATFN